MHNIFCILQKFFLRLAGKPRWDLATVTGFPTVVSADSFKQKRETVSNFNQETFIEWVRLMSIVIPHLYNQINYV